MKQGDVILRLFVPADQDAAKPIHPAVRPFYHPPPRLLPRLPLDLLGLFPPRLDLLGELKLVRALTHLVEVVGLVQAYPLRLLLGRPGPLYRDACERLPEQLPVVAVGAVHGQAKRDPCGVRQQVGRKEEMQQTARQEGPYALADDVGQHTTAWKAAGQEEADSEGGIQMSTGNFAHGVNHRQYDQAKGESNAGMGHGSAADVVDDDGARAREDEGESPEGLRDVWPHCLLRPADACRRLMSDATIASRQEKNPPRQSQV